MYICLCNAVTESAIRDAVDQGARTLGELRLFTGCSSVCGTCQDLAEEVLAEALDSHDTGNVVYLRNHAA